MTLQSFTIEANEYLQQNIQAYYRCDYIKYKQPNNPDYLVTLKNTFKNLSESQLKSAVNQLASTLTDEVLEILSLSKQQSIAICVVPRAKSLDSYAPSQLLFRLTIQHIILKLQQHYPNIIDGTNYIVRHTDTRTTHLPNDAGNGSDPYPGITKNTCTLSPEIKGKNILLIDDIYTKTINVDEDAIQALLDCGAQNVTFFAIARTVYKGYATYQANESNSDINPLDKQYNQYCLQLLREFLNK
ncbi:phosphoribosyltransferase [Conchiformibius steedae DSM 2580]|uniref:Phosphoribosyltransferase n=1 Tax=Conchiformibius steedae DSM 2580 TaxID=1121352 RepID=A0AAE9HXD8_9NEIS|nr:phosphoribosyltransferase [Conchiformibius steedae]QMT32972.1 phosphoribosyltransferase [Conchiformibius steedae]URD67595.1 phosphoribosyltransferase [Conchiformibius steedae DSM 2580]